MPLNVPSQTQTLNTLAKLTQKSIHHMNLPHMTNIVYLTELTKMYK